MRTRFAPSPTGHLHLGNARTALLNWLVARHHDGAFVLRFEDTDVERQVDRTEATIRESLEWLGIGPDEGPEIGGPHGPYRQSARTEAYRKRAEELLGSGHAFRCYCLPEELEARRQEALERGDQPVYDGTCRDLDESEEAALREKGREPTVRLRVDPGPITFRDRIRGEVTIHGSEFGDFVLLRSDGRPTYNFAVVVDDIGMEITHVIRGAGHLSNTPKQVLLYRAFGASLPEFIHIPMVLGPGGSPLSKREGSPAVLDYRRRGFHPDGVVNYLSLLSWSSESGREVLSREELIREVDPDRLGVADAELDPEKMAWLSGQHIRREDPDRLARLLSEHLPVERRGLDADDLVRLAGLVRERIELLTEALPDAETVFGEPDLEETSVREALEMPGAAGVLGAAAEILTGVEEWSLAAVQEALSEIADRSGASGRGFYHPLRAALTGELQGPEMAAVVWAQGRERATRRLRSALEWLEAVP